MNTVERVKLICRERKVAISKLERDCNFSNGYINSLKKGTFPNDRLQRIADYFGVNIAYFYNEEEQNHAYYLDDETKRIAQIIFERPKLKEIFNMFVDLSDEEAITVIPILQALSNRANNK